MRIHFSGGKQNLTFVYKAVDQPPTHLLAPIHLGHILSLDGVSGTHLSLFPYCKGGCSALPTLPDPTTWLHFQEYSSHPFFPGDTNLSCPFIESGHRSQSGSLYSFDLLICLTQSLPAVPLLFLLATQYTPSNTPFPLPASQVDPLAWDTQNLSILQTPLPYHHPIKRPYLVHHPNRVPTFDPEPWGT